MELLNLIKVLWQKKLIVFLIVLISLVSSILFSFLTPDIYSSTAQLATGITDNQDVSISQEQQALTFFSTQNKFSNLIENMNSQQVLILLSYNFAIHDLTSANPFQNIDEFRKEYASYDLYKIANSLQNKLDSLQVLTRLNESDTALLAVLSKLEYDVPKIEENLSIIRIPSTDYVKIEYFSEDPLMAAFAVNTLSQEFIRYFLTSRGERSSSSIQFLADLVRSKQSELEEKVNGLKDFKASNEVVNLNLQSESIIQQITELEKSREEERKKIYGYEQSIKKINEQLSGNELNILEQQAKVINNRIVRLKEKINTLNNQIIRSGSKSEALVSQLEELRRELNEQIIIAGQAVPESGFSQGPSRQKLLTDRVNNEVELEIAKGGLISINREIDRLKGNVSGFASKEAQINAYERDIEVAQDEYINAVNKLNEARLLSQNVGSSLRQVEFGYPSDKPVKSRDLLIIAISVAASFLMTIVVIILFEYIDLSPRNVTTLKRITGLTSIGYLSELPIKYTSPEYLFKLDSRNENLKLFREQLRDIRYEIESCKSQIFLISSLKTGAGKTVFLLTMPLLLSVKNKRVLIIDMNFRNNYITKLFKNKSFIERIQPNDDRLDRIPTGTGFKGVDVIGCEGGNYTPEEVFPDDLLNNLLNEMRKKYDYIFIEGAALDNFADSKEISKYVDSFMLIVSADQQITSQDQASVSFVKRYSDKFIGAILNKCKQVDI